MKIKTCRFANAVKVGGPELTYITDQYYDIELVSEHVIRITDKKTKQAAFSSLFNVPFWTMDESELEMEAEGIPPVENLDIAAKGKKKK